MLCQPVSVDPNIKGATICFHLSLSLSLSPSLSPSLSLPLSPSLSSICIHARTICSNINPPLFMETPYRQLNWLYLIFINVWQLLNPYFLCPDWRFGTIPLITSFLDLRNILTLTTLTCTISLGVYGLHYDTMHAKKLLFGCCLMVITFLPASNLFIPVGFVVAERVLYLPSMGFCYLVAYGMTTLVKSFKSWIFRITVVILASILLGLLASRAILRNEDWKTNISLYTSGVRCNPNNGVMLTNLGIQHGKIKPQNLIFSEKLYRRAMKVAPQFSGGFSNFGGLMQALKRYDEAEEVSDLLCCNVFSIHLPPIIFFFYLIFWYFTCISLPWDTSPSPPPQ